jgi:hypothetical protein
LGNDWTILHHVSWQSLRDGRQGDGEADFLLVHPKIGLIVIEVKGGGIDVHDGRWYSTDRNGVRHPIKNPYEQAVASKYALLKWLKSLGFARCPLGHAVVFPHIDKLPPLGPAATRQITFLRSDLPNIEIALRGCARHWALTADLPKSDVNEIIRHLAPSVRLNRSLSEASAAAESRLIELTAEQVAAFAGLRASRGGLILGAAGTGKTVLAIARAQQLGREGFNTLFVCYNEILGNELATSTQDTERLSTGTFHSLCFREANRARISVPSSPSTEWWENDAAEILVEACDKTETTFDAIVIDEGQDFAPSWIDALRCITAQRDDTPFYVFADPRQDIWMRNWASSIDFQFSYELHRNLRNTHPIAEKVSASIGEALRPPFGAHGPPVRWRDLRDETRPLSDILAAVEQLIDHGFGPQNLVVLCAASTTAQHLREHSVGPYSFGAWRSNGIPVETIARFKGMEAEAIVLVLESGQTERDRTACYVGLSRARSVLVVIGPANKRNFINWAR